MSDLEHRPSSELLAEALALTHSDPESDTRQRVIWELHRRASDEIFLAAQHLSAQSDPLARVLAAEVLGQLGSLEYEGKEELRPFTRQSLPILRRLLQDQDDLVIAAAITALGHHYRFEPIVEVPTLASHTSLRVRLATAMNLWPAYGGMQFPVAVDMLIRLSEDEDESVRDWATFSLGSIVSPDMPEIREALYRRLDDSDFDTRSEAMIGLAERKDPRVVPFIAAALAADTVGALTVEAAGVVGSPELLPMLLELRSWWDVDTKLLETAIRNCGGVER
jgi:HEAT repeat protein